jgi:hypothetical protein
MTRKPIVSGAKLLIIDLSPCRHILLLLPNGKTFEMFTIDLSPAIRHISIVALPVPLPYR